MAGQISKPTRAIEKASVSIMKALERAKANMADIPLGQVKYDPRTERKRAQEGQIDPHMDTTLRRILYEQRQNNG